VAEPVPPPVPKQAEPVPPPVPKVAEPVSPPVPKVAEPVPPPVPKQAEPVPPPVPKVAEPVSPPVPKQAEPVSPPVPKQAEPVPPPAPKVAEPVSPPGPKQAEPVSPSVPKQAEPPKAAEVVPAPAPPAERTVAACRENLTKIAGAGPILFDRGSSRLSDASLETLDRLAAATKQCPGVLVTIEGHADVEGSRFYNQRLSVRRAQAVAAYLVKAGADAGQLATAGFGASRPAAPNNTAENKARNRRIEFIVRGR
jgi:outer membrane protein OmpA-like peptidoglycan-associated protein